MALSYRHAKPEPGPTVPVPQTSQELIEFLNLAPHINWNLTLENGMLYGGDQPLFIPKNEESLYDFLCGCFVATFGGNSLENIRRKIQA